MTKKDYEKIAYGLNHGRPSRLVNPYNIEAKGKEAIDIYAYGKDNAWNNACKTLSDYLQMHDVRFDKKKFLTLCGIED